MRDDTGATSNLQKAHSQEASTAEEEQKNLYNPLLVKMEHPAPVGLGAQDDFNFTVAIFRVEGRSMLEYLVGWAVEGEEALAGQGGRKNWLQVQIPALHAE